MGVTQSGVVEVLGGIENFRKGIKKKAVDSIKLVCLELFNLSADEVPVEVGDLKASEHTWLEPEGGDGFNTVGFVGYHLEEYALTVHEDLTLRHGKEYNERYAAQIAAGATNPWSGRKFIARGENEKAEYLRGPAYENIHEFFNIIRDTMQK